MQHIHGVVGGPWANNNPPIPVERLFIHTNEVGPHRLAALRGIVDVT